MQVNQPPVVLIPQTINPSVQGDRAARRFGIFFLGALAAVTIGAGVGIGVGNIAHYRYFGPNNNTNLSSADVFNLTDYSFLIQAKSLQSMIPVAHGKKRESLKLWLSSIVKSPTEDEHNNHQ
ncbi:unnamed protein product [Adineta steineri]|uniref:Uncharacterized protein n=1 Tax=Adineta steineri TaxID=433720 RepID=A0A814MG61_9BILA|nr:unnamed protein product [Adineta steineri]